MQATLPKIPDLGPHYRRLWQDVVNMSAAESLWRQDAADLVERGNGREAATTDGLLQILHEMQRLERLTTAGLSNNEAFRTAIQTTRLPLWRDFTSPPAPVDLQHRLAARLYNCDPKKNDVALLSLGDGAREIGKWLVEHCLSQGVKFIAFFADPAFDVLVLNHADEAGVKHLADSYVATSALGTKRIVARSGLPDREPPPVDEVKQRLYNKGIKPYSDRLRSGELFYTLTAIPTKRDAEIDGIPYEEYTKLFFEMCDQPWKQIGAAQEKLIAEFDAGKRVRIVNSDGTDISMDIEGFTFCNSLIAKNVPGSEIFTAPRRDSVEGIIMAQGRFTPPDGKGGIIENIFMKFSKGRLERFDAEKGLDLFKSALAIDEGARFVGELGIGTNPHLRRHVANGLLVEKIGGSFHLALGACYSFKEYAGKPVNVDNGNTSALHWDITTMLHGKHGKIWLDNKLMMDNGLWVDAEYDVLNRGWQSIPVNERPEYWKKH